MFPCRSRNNCSPGDGATGRHAENDDYLTLYATRKLRITPINHAGAAAARATGFSTIGMLISAESTPNRIASHHTTLYEPVRSNAMPPIQTPRKPPTWWLKKAKPAKVASQ